MNYLSEWELEDKTREEVSASSGSSLEVQDISSDESVSSYVNIRSSDCSESSLEEKISSLELSESNSTSEYIEEACPSTIKGWALFKLKMCIDSCIFISSLLIPGSLN